MTEVLVKSVFDHAFQTVSEKILGMSLVRQEDAPEELNWQYDTDKVMIFTTGFFDAEIICEFTPELFECIIALMNGGLMPPMEERQLYIKEYINIVCGYAISKLNNVMGTVSRLSVPHFQKAGEALEMEGERQERSRLCYETEAGALNVTIFYSLDYSDKRRVKNG